MTAGKVYLIGAGPGDPDLITRKGLRLIQNADVIIYDRLIPMDLLCEARPGAELVNAGKAPSKHRLSQDDINHTLISKALQGKQVVRLKGGDPFVFGRGGEEAIVCARYGIPFEVVPGISSSYAVPAYAGIPLTHRHVSRSFTVITGHDADSIAYEALVAVGGTLVILMGVGNLEHITANLLAAGLDLETPAAAIEWGAMEAQRVIEGTVETLAERANEAALEPPATIVIGDVVSLRAQGVRWFDRIPELAWAQQEVG